MMFVIHMNDAPIQYVFRPKPFAAETSLDLEPRQIRAWRAGKETIILLKDIETIRLHFAPKGINFRGYKAKIYTRSGKTLVFEDRSWRGMIEQEHLDGPYRTFVTALCRSVVKANPRVLLFAGMTALPYWFSTIFGAAFNALLLILAVRALMGGQLAFGAAIFGFTGLFALWSWRYSHRNRPRTFTADAIPADILPPA